ncbi:glycosyltransferase family 2 protein [Paenibacillus whitsoniae]|nr:glycosyltransferase family 2 protein [Paenibacillus whitsoniae]
MLPIRGPKISIITASYNSESTIKQTIQSVSEQTYSNIEYIVIDGGSIDRTKDILRANRSSISHLVSEPDKGIYDAFNKGVSKSTGDIIYFLNSDDSLYDQYVIEDIARFFVEHPEADFLCAKVLAKEFNSDFSYKMGKYMTLDDFKSGQTYPHQGFFAKKKLFERYKGFNLKYKLAADLDFMLKCFEDNNNSFHFLDRIVALFRLGGASNGSSGRQDTINEANFILREHFGVEDQLTAIAPKEELQGLYKSWLEKLLLNKRGISSVLKDLNVNRIAIFGAMKTGLYLLEDCLQFGVEVLTFLDNNQAMHNEFTRGVSIQSPDWLRSHHSQIDGVVISVEGPVDHAIRNQIFSIAGSEIKVFTWKELILLL